MQSIIYIFPELFLSLSIMFLLMLGVFVKKSFKLINMLTILSLIFTIALVINQPDEVLNNMDNWNTSQHGKSGLTEKVKNSDEVFNINSEKDFPRLG